MTFPLTLPRFMPRSQLTQSLSKQANILHEATTTFFQVEYFHIITQAWIEGLNFRFSRTLKEMGWFLCGKTFCFIEEKFGSSLGVHMTRSDFNDGAFLCSR